MPKRPGAIARGILCINHKPILAIMKKNPKVFKHARVPAKLRLVCLVLLLASFAMTAQAGLAGRDLNAARFLPPQTITGRVTDSKNAPMEGVSITIKGTNRGVTTNAAGTFSFPNVPDNAVLVFSSTGFGTREMSVKANQTAMNVTLSEIVSGLNDVVVVGYGTQSKKDLTGSVSQIKATQLENENPRSIQDMLRGNAPGLDVGFDGATRAGAGATLQVRGKGALAASGSPLIVLDGVIYPGDLADINPNDINTIDILKDASAAAVFGSRSSNGIILITTKKGKAGKPVITFNDNIGLNRVTNKPHLLTGEEFVQWRSDVIWAFNGFDSTSKPGVKYKFVDPKKLGSNIDIATWSALDNSTGDPTTIWLTRLRMKPIEITNYLAGKQLDWEKLIYNQNAMQHDHTISISQRKDESSYYFSLGYLENNGITVGDRFKTLRSRLNLESNISKFLTVGVNFQFSERDESTVPVSLNDVIQTSPWGSYLSDDGTTLRLSPNDDPGNNAHPFMGQKYTDRMYKYDNFFLNLSAKGKLPYGFSYEVHYAPTFNLLREYNHQSALNPLISGRKGIVDRRNQTVYNWTNDNIIRWNGKYGKHSIEATFLFNAEKNQSWNTTLHAENFAPNDNLSYNAVQSATLPITANTDDRVDTRDAIMGRLTYNYNQRYFLTATMRKDGYSGFGAEVKTATFPAISLAWALSEEKFMAGTAKWLDYAKLRVSYGENGNSSLDNPYRALATLGSGSYVYVTPGGVANNVISVFSANLPNPNLKWERKQATNLGLDFSVMKGIVSGSIDVYNAHTKDLLVTRSLPSVTGFANIYTNLGEIQNKGFEVSLNTQNMKRRNFEWRSTISFWSNRNRVLHLYGATPDYDATGKQIGTSEKDDLTNNWYIGHDLSSIYNYQVIGVWQQADAALAKTYGYKPGDFRLKDTNGDGQYSIADKEFQGQTAPKFSWNLRNEFRIYQNFDFSFTLNAKMGNIYQRNEDKNSDHFYDRSNFYSRPYWTPNNPINDYAALNSNVGGPVSWNVYKSAAFVRVSNVSLAYSLPAAKAAKLGFQGIKAYVNVVNAGVFTSWNYFDPEYKGSDPANPTNTAPVPITFNVGLNISL